MTKEHRYSYLPQNRHFGTYCIELCTIQRPQEFYLYIILKALLIPSKKYVFRKKQARGGKVINFCFRKVSSQKIRLFVPQNRQLYFLAIYSQTIASRNKFESVIGRYWWYLAPWCIIITLWHSGRTQEFPKHTLVLAAETTSWVLASQYFSYRNSLIYTLSFWSWINYEHTLERDFFLLLF